jgi:hypothetical protein
MKKRMSTIFSLALSLLFIAGVSFASFSQPKSGAPNDNAFGYIDIGGVPGGADAGIKLGGLAVNTFTANNNALFKDQVYFNNPIHGVATDPAINFGDATHMVGVTINKNITGSALQSDTVKNKYDSAKKGYDYLCSDADGTIILCGEGTTTEFDLCTNLPPSQDSDGTKVPDGYVRNIDGTCSPVTQQQPKATIALDSSPSCRVSGCTGGSCKLRYNARFQNLEFGTQYYAFAVSGQQGVSYSPFMSQYFYHALASQGADTQRSYIDVTLGSYSGAGMSAPYTVTLRKNTITSGTEASLTGSISVPSGAGNIPLCSGDLEQSCKDYTLGGSNSSSYTWTDCATGSSMSTPPISGTKIYVSSTTVPSGMTVQSGIH